MLSPLLPVNPVELSLYPARFNMYHSGLKPEVLLARVVNGLRVGDAPFILWGPASRHEKLGATETQTIHLSRPMANRLANFALANLAGMGEESYNCFDFANALNGWPRDQQVLVAREANKTTLDTVQNGMTYWIKSPDTERLTGDPFSHALLGIGPDCTLSVVGPSRNRLGEIVLADASELMRVFRGAALLDVVAAPAG